ncbi:hypothetical protein C8R44DRAFT_893296 [Mycena epipterygia]|nr:hypothetical protein C8R44DRAFT_893296 [Mycena epipterygia]
MRFPRSTPPPLILLPLAAIRPRFVRSAQRRRRCTPSSYDASALHLPTLGHYPATLHASRAGRDYMLPGMLSPPTCVPFNLVLCRGPRDMYVLLFLDRLPDTMSLRST